MNQQVGDENVLARKLLPLTDRMKKKKLITNRCNKDYNERRKAALNSSEGQEKLRELAAVNYLICHCSDIQMYIQFNDQHSLIELVIERAGLRESLTRIRNANIECVVCSAPGTIVEKNFSFFCTSCQQFHARVKGE